MRLIFAGAQVHFMHGGDLYPIRDRATAERLFERVPAVSLDRSLPIRDDAPPFNIVDIQDHPAATRLTYLDMAGRVKTAILEYEGSIYIDLTDGFHRDGWCSPVSTFSVFSPAGRDCDIDVKIFLPTKNGADHLKTITVESPDGKRSDYIASRGDVMVIKIRTSGNGQYSLMTSPEPYSGPDLRHLGFLLSAITVSGDDVNGDIFRTTDLIPGEARA